MPQALVTIANSNPKRRQKKKNPKKKKNPSSGRSKSLKYSQPRIAIHGQNATLATGRTINRVTRMKQQENRSSNMAQVEKSVASIVLPELQSGCRWSSAFASSPTAIAHPWSLTPDSSALNSQTTKGLPPANGMAFVFRDPLRAIVRYDGNPTNLTYTYEALFWSTSSTAPPTTTLTVLGGSQPTPMPVLSYASTNASYQPHGEEIYTGVLAQDGGHFVWLDKNVVVSLSYTQATSSTAGTLLCYRYKDGRVDRDNTHDIAVASTTPAIGTTTISDSGYYAYSLYIPDHSTIISYLSFSGSSSVWCHLPIPDLPNNMAAAQGIRIMGASLKLTNKASPLNRQGEVTGVQLPEGEDWYKYASLGFGSLSTLNNATTMPADNGMYGFLKPTKPQDFDLISGYEIQDGYLVDTHFRIDSETACLVIAYEITPEEGRNLYWTTNFAIEYTTTDVWRALDVSYLSPNETEEVLAKVKYVKQFHENPVHWKELWSKIVSIAKSASNAITQYGPAVLKTAATIGAMLV